MIKKSEFKSNTVSEKKANLKVISKQKVSGKINITIRIISKPLLDDKKSVKTFIEKSKVVLPKDPSDFIEPEPPSREFMSTDDKENDKCDSFPILPRHYTIRPSVVLRNTLKRKYNKIAYLGKKKSKTMKVKRMK